jgi:hypothetical protein
VPDKSHEDCYHPLPEVFLPFKLPCCLIGYVYSVSISCGFLGSYRCGRGHHGVEVYDLIRSNNVIAEKYRDATRGIYLKDYSSIEFHDKQYLMNVLSQLPIEVVYDLRKYN